MALKQPLTRNMKRAIAMCAKDPDFFIDNFCQVTHPTAGIMPFHTFSYQKNILKTFQNGNRKYIFHNYNSNWHSA